MVDVQHRALRAFEENCFAFVERGVQKFRGIDDQAANVRRELEILFEKAGGFERMAVSGMADCIFFEDHALEFFAETIGVEQIAHANSAARHFVFVRRTDSARGGSDFRSTARLFSGFVHFAMIGKNQVGAIAEKKPPANFDAGFFQIFEFGDERRRIDHGAGTNHSSFLGPQNAAGNQLQDVTMAVEDDGVPGVVAAGITRDVIKRGGHIVDDLAFSFVAPLRANYDHCLRRRLVHFEAILPASRTFSGRTIPRQSHSVKQYRKDAEAKT